MIFKKPSITKRNLLLMYVYDIQHDKIKLSLMCWVAVESVHLAGSVSGRRHVVVENALRNQSFVRLAHAFRW